MLLALVAALLPFSFERHISLWNALSNAFHLPFVAVVAILLFSTMSEASSLKKRLQRTALWGAVFVVIVEIFQPLVGRTQSLTDLLNGLMGLAAALAGIVLRAYPEKRKMRVFYLLCLLFVFAAAFFPFITEMRIVILQAKRFPILGDFEESWELSLWSPETGGADSPTVVSLSSDRASHGQKSLAVNTDGNGWNTVRFRAEGGDWSAYKYLCLDVYNPSHPFTLSVRIDDNGDCLSYEDRYNETFAIRPGWNEIAISIDEIRNAPAKRKFDLTHVKRLLFFTGPKDPPVLFYSDHVRLALLCNP